MENISSSTSSPSRKHTDESSVHRTTTPISAIAGQPVVHNPAIRQPRASRKSTGRTNSALNINDPEVNTNDGDYATAQLIADLRDQVLRAEQASEQYRSQLEHMRKKIDDMSDKQTEAEERDYQRQTEVDHLRAEIKDSTRERRETENVYESEKKLLLQERQDHKTKILELQNVVGRLNETLRLRNVERANSSRNVSQATPTHNDENNIDIDKDPTLDDYIHTIHEKDRAIELMRLELAEVHLNAAQQEHLDDGHLQHLEKEILETKMQNARLIEENESFQMLLSQRTLKGDFFNDPQAVEYPTDLSTLAEELEPYTEDSEGQGDAYKKLENENRTLKEGNKALTLYIDKIIGRLLQHDGFEHIILDNDEPPEPPAKTVLLNKALPAPPDAASTTAGTAVANGATSLLQRAKSVVSKPAPKPRPVSYMPVVPTAHENPETAPSIPLNRGHRRSRSDQVQQDLGAAAVVQQMNRSSPLRTASGGPMSPRIAPVSPQLGHSQPSYFPPVPPPAAIAATARKSSTSQGAEKGSSRNSLESGDDSARPTSTDTSSGQNSIPGTIGSPPANIPGAVMKQNQLRPLRLLQSQKEDEQARKRANRSSWMGWFKGNPADAQSEGQQF